MPYDSPEPCKPEACAIQNCLMKFNHDESKCTKLIDQLYLCCKQYYEQKGTDEQTTCCPKFSLLKLKLKQRELGSIDASLIDTKKG